MKKLMFAAAVAAGLVAFGDGIESANTVGYTTKALTSGQWYICGVQFEAPAGGNMELNEYVQGTYTGVDFDFNDEFMATAPQIQILNGSTYTYYYYLNDGWYDDGTTEGATKAGWCDMGGNITSDTVAPGSSFWFRSLDASCTIQNAGQVVSATTPTVSAVVGWNLIGNAFPTDLDLNDATWTGIQGVDFDFNDEFMATAPQIQVLNGSTYTYYYYLNDGWYDDGTTEGATKAGWCDMGGNIMTDSIPAGSGFWFKANEAVTIGFSK